MLFTGDAITAEQAQQLGMVSDVVPLPSSRTTPSPSPSGSPASPSIGLKLAKQAVNQTLDAQGHLGSLQAAFSLHELGHAHNMVASTARPSTPTAPPSSARSRKSRRRPEPAAPLIRRSRTGRSKARARGGTCSRDLHAAGCRVGLLRAGLDWIRWEISSQAPGAIPDSGRIVMLSQVTRNSVSLPLSTRNTPAKLNFTLFPVGANGPSAPSAFPRMWRRRRSCRPRRRRA